MPFLKGPEGRRETADGRKENGELPPGRVGARGLSQPAGLFCLPEPISAGSARGGPAAASAPAAGWCPQPVTWPPSASAAATPPKGSILQPPKPPKRALGLRCSQ